MKNSNIKRVKIMCGITGCLMAGISMFMTFLGILSLNNLSFQEIFMKGNREAVIAILAVCVIGIFADVITSASIQTRRNEAFLKLLHTVFISFFIVWIIAGDFYEKVIFIVNLISYASYLLFISTVRYCNLIQYRDIKNNGGAQP